MDHEAFKSQASVNRFLFAAITGVWFHFLYHSFDLSFLTWQCFLAFDLIFVSLVTLYEKDKYIVPIKNMIWQSEESLKNKPNTSEEGEDKDNKLAQGLEMMDKMLKMTEMKAVKRVTSVWGYIQMIRGIFEDYLFYGFGVLAADSALRSVNKMMGTF